MKLIKLITFKIVEILTIVLVPYWLGVWGQSWTEWLCPVYYNNYDPTTILGYWSYGLGIIFIFVIGYPIVIATCCFVILGFVYWNLKLAGYKPVWFWTENKDKQEDE